MPRPRPATLGRLLLASVFAAVIGAGFTPLSKPDVAQASSTIGRTAETTLLAKINNARVSKGLRVLRLDTRLRDLAEYRAGVMNSKNTMSHTVAGSLSTELADRHIQNYSWGECIAWDAYSYPTDAINLIFQMWHDASHWPLLMSSKFNYVGLGIVHNSSNNKTWASLVLTESVDHTGAHAANRSSSRSGSNVTWSWAGQDVLLQTHTSGLKNFDVEYKVGSGTWSIIRSGTTATSITLTSRASGHTYYVRVRARDNKGNVGTWTAAVGISVP